MKNEYDFEDDSISQHMANIQIPNITQPRKSLTTYSNQNLPNYQPNLKHALQNLLKLEKQEKQQKVEKIKEKQKLIGNELNRQKAQKQKKIMQITEREREKVIAACTFKPTINNKAENRNLSEFLNSQQSFVKKVISKRQSLKKTLLDANKQVTFKPKINTNKKSVVSVFDRLTSPKQNGTRHSENLYDHSFHPKITEKSKNIRRTQPINQLLYQDAIRRNQKNKQIASVSHTQSLIPKPVNYRNEKYAAQKFIKQYCSVLSQLNAQSGKIDYITFNEILKAMGFVIGEQQGDCKASNKQRQLVHKAFQLLSNYCLNQKNICVFLLSLIAIYHINPINFYNSNSQQFKELVLNQTEGRKIQKEYNLLYRNRLSSESIRKTEQPKDNYTFHPTINKQSQQLAEKYRNQMMNEANELLEQHPQIEFNIPQNRIINHTDLLVLHRRAKDVQNQKKKNEKLQRSLQQCTFKPTILSSAQTLNNSKAQFIEGNIGERKCIELYNYHKSLKSKRQSLRASVEVESIDKQCTFMPRINKGIKENQVGYIPNTQSTIYRMMKGREESQKRKSYLERGENKIYSHQSKSAQDMPKLIVDVNMGQKVQQIYIYDGDQDRLYQIAQQFGKAHKLDKNSQNKLVQLLRIQIGNALGKISQNQESENDQLQ